MTSTTLVCARHLLVFLQTGGSYKATAERLVLHKNTVQYRIRKAEESLGRAVGDDRHDVELALQVSSWLGAAVLHPAAVPAAGERAAREASSLTAPGRRLNLRAASITVRRGRWRAVPARRPRQPPCR